MVTNLRFVASPDMHIVCRSKANYVLVFKEPANTFFVRIMISVFCLSMILVDLARFWGAISNTNLIRI